MAPSTEPIMRNGVPPLNSRSPQKSKERSEIQTIESFVVCAGTPTCRTSQRRSSDQTVTFVSKVRNGGALHVTPLDVVPDAVVGRRACSQQLGAGLLVRHDGGAGQEVVAVGVVTVVVRVDHLPRPITFNDCYAGRPGLGRMAPTACTDGCAQHAPNSETRQ